MKALLVAIQPKWLKKILDGEKKFEFRNWKVPVGTVLYFYCTKAKPYLWYEQHYTDMPEFLHSGSETLNYIGITENDVLNGKVVAKAVVKDVYEYDQSTKNYIIYTDWNNINQKSFKKDNDIGYSSKKYALQLSQVEEIDPKDITEFVGCSRVENYKMKYYKLNEIPPVCDNNGKNCKWHKETSLHITTPPQSRTWVYINE